MATFATTGDLGTYLGETLTGTRLAQATQALEMATAEIQSWTRRRLELVEDDIVVLTGSRDRELVLPDWPVVEVAAVEVDGVAVAASSYRRIGQTLYRESGWGVPGGTVEVVYTHGYDPIPDDIKSVTIQLAARTLQNPMGIRQEGIGSYSVTYGGDDPGGPAGTLLGTLGRYRRRAASPSLAREPWGPNLPVDV